jgi:hypothetical protein
MRRCGRGVDWVNASGVRFSVLGGSRARCVRLAGAMVGLVCMCVVGFVGSAMAAAEACPNAALRVGPSASLPDCRAYELVTPEALGRTQDMTFTGEDHAIPSSDGEHIALEALATPLEPNPEEASANIIGTDAVFSRTPAGWTMKSATAPGTAADRPRMRLFSPDLSQVALVSYTALNLAETSNPPAALEVGLVGGPYAVAANLPEQGGTSLLGANAGTASVPAFSHVLFESTDHALLPHGTERTLAEETFAGATDLYEWTDGALRLVNVEGEGASVKLVNRCGATLGEGSVSTGGAGTIGAVSDDGSKVFFTTRSSGADCSGPRSLYMRVDGRETVEVSPLESVAASERREVHYNGASPDGSEVFFNTSTPLIAGETPSEPKLFMYDTAAGVLTRIPGEGTTAIGSQGNLFLLSEDGTTVYYVRGGSHIYRYDVQTGEGPTLVATFGEARTAHEPSYATPNGEFLVFVAGGIEGEPRGAGHNELYRYDAVDGSVMCVSCGEGVAPASGEVIQPAGLTESVLETADETPPFIQMSENGQEVFFETTAQLVPQDTNSTETVIDAPHATGYSGMDVYEWEADGAGGCELSQGCTHLLSSGEDQGPSLFLGASSDGRNVFFSSAAQLVPQAAPEFTNIYDARVEGGFAPPASAPKCLSCHGVGSPPPLFSVPAGVSFVGAGNPAVHGKIKRKGERKKRRRGKSKGGKTKKGRGAINKRAKRGGRS